MTDIALPTGSRVDSVSVFTSLADIVRQGSTPQELYAAICVAATLMVPGCERASLMIRRGRAYSTAAATDAFAHKIDKLEQLLADGPCIDAIEEDTVQLESDLAAGNRWPAFAARVIAETPVRGAMSIRVSLDRGKVGAVNLFSDTSKIFDDASVERATVLAAFASVATSAAAYGEEAAALRRALASNRTIGKAIGMLMVLNEVSADDAFGVLRRISQDTNAKLADVAADFIRRRSAQQP